MTMCRMILPLCAVAGFVLLPAAPRTDEPVLRIAKQGSMEAGGKTIDCTTNDGGDPNSARVYDTPPDGREGWLTLFLREGFPVYGVDRPNTGRSGTDICEINAVKLGRAPARELPAINRYAAESSWVTFRWGPKFGEPYPNTQFPIEFADNY